MTRTLEAKLKQEHTVPFLNTFSSVFSGNKVSDNYASQPVRMGNNVKGNARMLRFVCSILSESMALQM